MKSNIFAISTALAAIAALVMLPVNAIAAGGNVILVIGILAVFAVDYSRTLKPLKLRARIIAFDSNERASDISDAAA